jgi:hypothetical protein
LSCRIISKLQFDAICHGVDFAAIFVAEEAMKLLQVVSAPRVIPSSQISEFGRAPGGVHQHFRSFQVLWNNKFDEMQAAEFISAEERKCTRFAKFG